jgi:hypothetical protein
MLKNFLIVSDPVFKFLNNEISPYAYVKKKCQEKLSNK